MNYMFDKIKRGSPFIGIRFSPECITDFADLIE